MYLYHRDACHLCDKAWAMLKKLGLAACTQHVNIDDDPADSRRYWIRIPVLKNTKGQELNWPFTEQQIKELIDS